MNVNIFSYSVLASILGIMIVFTSLCGLSLLMVALKAIFKEHLKKLPATKEVSLSSSENENSDWIMAAISVFLIEEDIDVPSAIAWYPQISEKNNFWINKTSFNKKTR
jgi:hypothetical protein